MDVDVHVASRSGTGGARTQRPAERSAKPPGTERSFRPDEHWPPCRSANAQERGIDAVAGTLADAPTAAPAACAAGPRIGANQAVAPAVACATSIGIILARPAINGPRSGSIRLTSACFSAHWAKNLIRSVVRLSNILGEGGADGLRPLHQAADLALDRRIERFEGLVPGLLGFFGRLSRVGGLLFADLGDLVGRLAGDAELFRGGQRIIVDRGRSRRGDRGRFGLKRGAGVGRPCVPGDLVGLDLLVERIHRRLRRAARLVDLVLERLARRRCIIGGALSAPAAAAAELHLSGLRLPRGRQAAEIAIVKPFASPKDAGDCSMRVIGGVPGGVEMRLQAGEFIRLLARI